MDVSEAMRSGSPSPHRRVSDFFIPYMLFAMLTSPDLGGIIPAEAVNFSPKDLKTASKFGKSWTRTSAPGA